MSVHPLFSSQWTFLTKEAAVARHVDPTCHVPDNDDDDDDEIDDNKKIPDGSTCSICKKSFGSFFNRPKYCTCCGISFCDAHVPKIVLVKNTDLLRATAMHRKLLFDVDNNDDDFDESMTKFEREIVAVLCEKNSPLFPLTKVSDWIAPRRVCQNCQKQLTKHVENMAKKKNMNTSSSSSSSNRKELQKENEIPPKYESCNSGQSSSSGGQSNVTVSSNEPVCCCDTARTTEGNFTKPPETATTPSAVTTSTAASPQEPKAVDKGEGVKTLERDEEDEDSSAMMRRVCVMARFRPQSIYEAEAGGNCCVHVDPVRNQISIQYDSIAPKDPDTNEAEEANDEKGNRKKNKGKKDATPPPTPKTLMSPSIATSPQNLIRKEFSFDHALDPSCSQEAVYERIGPKLIDYLFDGVNASIFAYGQTGSGKTYTMMGQLNEKGAMVGNPGVVPRVLTAIFRRAAQIDDAAVEISLSFVEIYMEEIYDLIAAVDEKANNKSNSFGYRKVEKVPVGFTYGPDVQISAAVREVGNVDQAMKLLERGLRNRTTAATQGNWLSSRSHAVTVVNIAQKDYETKLLTTSQLYMIDLAGSERLDKTIENGLCAYQSRAINLSLLFLSQVIRKLALQAREYEKPEEERQHIHIPFRDSKLTQVLRNSIGGNSLCFMIVACSPSTHNVNETISTLRFGAQASMVKTTPVRNVSRTAEELELLLEQSNERNAQLQAEIAMLKQQLKSSGGNNGVGATSTTMSSMAVAPSKFESHNAKKLLRLQSILTSVVTCPITGEIMANPVVATDGYTYERQRLMAHFRSTGMLSPVTAQPLGSMSCTPNHMLRCLARQCGEESFLLLSADNTLRAPKSAFVVTDVIGVILDFLRCEEILGLGRVNSFFAQAVFDPHRWKPLVAPLLCRADARTRNQAEKGEVPLHKVYIVLKRGKPLCVDQGPLKYGLTLYSTGIPQNKRF